MNLMQNEALCMCCSDLTRYKRKKEEVSNKINLLERIVSYQRIDNKQYNEFKKKYHHLILYNESTHCHFMCGVCRKVNDIELRLIEDHLRNLLWKVFFLIYTQGDEELYYNTLRLLQGDYPIIYNSLKRLWYIRTKEVNVNEKFDL